MLKVFCNEFKMRKRTLFSVALNTSHNKVFFGIASTVCFGDFVIQRSFFWFCLLFAIPASSLLFVNQLFHSFAFIPRFHSFYLQILVPYLQKKGLKIVLLYSDASVKQFWTRLSREGMGLDYGCLRLKFLLFFAQWLALLLAPVRRLTKNLSGSYPVGCPTPAARLTSEPAIQLRDITLIPVSLRAVFQASENVIQTFNLLMETAVYNLQTENKKASTSCAIAG